VVEVLFIASTKEMGFEVEGFPMPTTPPSKYNTKIKI
jgi:hypothetical protein